MKEKLSLFLSLSILLIGGCSFDVVKTSFYETNDLQGKIYPHIKNFPFEISVIEPKDKKLIGSQYNIKILNMKNKKVQVIKEGKPFEQFTITDLLKIEDFNNDGYLDILASSIYPSSQVIDTLYIFDFQKQKFIKKMDDIPYDGTIRSTKIGCIKVEYIVRNGSDYLKPEDFCWFDGKWKSK